MPSSEARTAGDCESVVDSDGADEDDEGEDGGGEVEAHGLGLGLGEPLDVVPGEEAQGDWEFGVGDETSPTGRADAPAAVSARRGGPCRPCAGRSTRRCPGRR